MGSSPGKFRKPIKQEKPSSHFLRAILPSVNEHFQRILHQFILFVLFIYKTKNDMHMSVLVLYVDFNVQT